MTSSEKARPAMVQNLSTCDASRCLRGLKATDIAALEDAAFDMANSRVTGKAVLDAWPVDGQLAYRLSYKEGHDLRVLKIPKPTAFSLPALLFGFRCAGLMLWDSTQAATAILDYKVTPAVSKDCGAEGAGGGLHNDLPGGLQGGLRGLFGGIAQEDKDIARVTHWRGTNGILVRRKTVFDHLAPGSVTAAALIHDFADSYGLWKNWLFETEHHWGFCSDRFWLV